jgi:hypothetical protein
LEAAAEGLRHVLLAPVPLHEGWALPSLRPPQHHVSEDDDMTTSGVPVPSPLKWDRCDHGSSGGTRYVCDTRDPYHEPLIVVHCSQKDDVAEDDERPWYLVAAAPDLLKILREIVADDELSALMREADGHPGGSTLARAWEAIRKAEGRFA